MKVILTQDVANLGSLGDEVQVKPGYARNYLIPNGMALLVNSRKLKEIEHHRAHLEQLRKEAISGAQDKANEIKTREWTVTKKAGKGGKLFGSVTNRDLEDLLREAGVDIQRRDILIKDPIKNVGSHTVEVKLHTEVKTPITIKVVAEIDPEEEARLAAEAKRQAEAEAAENSDADDASEQEAALEAETETASE